MNKLIARLAGLALACLLAGPALAAVNDVPTNPVTVTYGKQGADGSVPIRARYTNVNYPDDQYPWQVRAEMLGAKAGACTMAIALQDGTKISISAWPGSLLYVTLSNPAWVGRLARPPELAIGNDGRNQWVNVPHPVAHWLASKTEAQNDTGTVIATFDYDGDFVGVAQSASNVGFYFDRRLKWNLDWSGFYVGAVGIMDCAQHYGLAL